MFSQNPPRPFVGCARSALAILVSLAVLVLPARGDFHLDGDFDCNYVVDLGDLSILLSHFGGPGTARTGDMDGNNLVELADLSAFLSNFGDRGCCAADLDGNSQVDLLDMQILIAHFGMAAGAMRTDGDLDEDGDVDAADLDRMTCAMGTSCCYDVNGDGVVDLRDLEIVIANQGMLGASYEDGDADCDGDVDMADANLVNSHFGRGC